MNLRDLAALAPAAVPPSCAGAAAAAADGSGAPPLPVTPATLTHDRVSLANDRRLTYTATTGRIVLDDELGRPAAAFFAVADTLARAPQAFFWSATRT